MRSFLQLGALIAFIWGAWHHHEQMVEFVAAPVVMAQHVGVGMEVLQIENALECHKACNQAYPDPRDFSLFLERNFHSRVKDVKVDQWGTAYGYRLLDGGRRFEVRSAGPDRIFGSSDDLILRNGKE